MAVAKQLPGCYRRNMKEYKLYFIGRFFATLCIALFVVEFAANPETAIWVLGALWLAPETAQAMMEARMEAARQRPE